MRMILLALFVLACAVPATEAAARESPRQEAASGSAQRAAKPARPSAARPATTLRRSSARSRIVTRSAAAATVSRDAMARCTRRNGRLVCAGARSSVAGWQSGLPPTDYAQTECPDGTFATLARGHDDVVRCMPL